MIDINVNNIFFKSYSVDPNSGHSIYVFDSTYLPSPEEIGDKQVYDLLIDELMDTLVAKLPLAPYSLVVFSSGFSKKKISWVYGIKMFSKLPTEARIYLQKTYIIHESFFIRTVYQVLTNAMSINFLKSSAPAPEQSDQDNNANDTTANIVHVSDLTALSHMIDITRLRISLNVYLHDYDITDYIDVPKEYFGRLTALGNRQYKQLIFDKIFKRLTIETVTHELVFQKPGSYKKVNILLDIIERSNYIDLSQWDIYSLASIFLHFIKNKSKPLIPIDLITLPLTDDFDYTLKTFTSIVEENNYYDLLAVILPLFIAILDAGDVTKHDLKTLSKALAPSLCKEKISMMSSDRLSIGIRFIKNLLIHFPKMKRTMDSTRDGRSDTVKTINMSVPISSPIAKDRSPVSQPIEKVMSQGPIPMLPKPRKSSPTKYSSKPSSRCASASTSPTRIAPPVPARRVLTSSSGTLDTQSTPTLKSRTPSVSIRISSDSSSVLADETLTASITPQNSKNDSTIVTTQPPTDELIKEMVQEQPKKDDNFEISKILEDAKKLTLDHNEKILTFDKEMKKKKKIQEQSVSSKTTKFSTSGYSQIKSENKVSKLAALYEERLQGISVINDMQRRMNNN